MEEKLQAHTVGPAVCESHGLLDAAAGLAEDPLHQGGEARREEANQASIAVMGNKVPECFAEDRGEAGRLEWHGRVQKWKEHRVRKGRYAQAPAEPRSARSWDVRR